MSLDGTRAAVVETLALLAAPAPRWTSRRLGLEQACSGLLAADEDLSFECNYLITFINADPARR